jgi:hypothetical protein
MSDDIRWTELGHGVRYTFTAWGEHDPVGIIEQHEGCSVSSQGGGIMFDLPGVADAFPGHPLWTLVQKEPLTLAPSLLCRACGHHGFIQEGRWVPA